MQNGWTAVMIACENGHLAIVRVLVEQKQANVNRRNKV
jgi:ankyrin repeat protein